MSSQKNRLTTIYGHHGLYKDCAYNFEDVTQEGFTLCYMGIRVFVSMPLFSFLLLVDKVDCIKDFIDGIDKAKFFDYI